MPRKKKDDGHQPMYCDLCGALYVKKRYLELHVNKCTGRKTNFKCEDCQVVYPNKTLYNTHMYEKHENPSAPTKKDLRRRCEGCNKMCSNITKMWRHVRKDHYNLQAKLPYYEQKKVNQVWFEKVLNCNSIIEIRRTAQNTLVMRKLDDNTTIKVIESNTKYLDLSHLYPTKNP